MLHQLLPEVRIKTRSFSKNLGIFSQLSPQASDLFSDFCYWYSLEEDRVPFLYIAMQRILCQHWDQTILELVNSGLIECRVSLSSNRSFEA